MKKAFSSKGLIYTLESHACLRFYYLTLITLEQSDITKEAV